MVKIVGIRFRTAGKIYYFDPLDFELETAMHVIVETARGIEMGTVLIPPKEVEDDKVVSTLKPVIRIATDEDEKIISKNKDKEKEAFAICKEKIIKHGLEMKLVDAEYTFDNNKLLFYFTADGRIDFRDLVKDLASVFRTRIELRQIGVRDETKMMGGIGICGRALCCSSYLSDFVPVSIKMAKEQNLSLNPTKISGVCGRLMCCLKYEQDTYEYLNSRLPAVGEKVNTPEGIVGEVKSISVLRQLVKVIIDNGDEKELREYTVDELKLKPRQRKDVKLTAEEIAELKGLEDNDSPETTDENRNQRSDRKRERNDRTERNDRAERNDRTERNDRAERNDRTERNDKAERNDRTEKNDRSDRYRNDSGRNDINKNNTSKGDFRRDHEESRRNDENNEENNHVNEENRKRQKNYNKYNKNNRYNKNRNKNREYRKDSDYKKNYDREKQDDKQ
ncbi:MAG: regulatory iron-sulfur-containing complex subunit RicT [Agathobacter sp.]|nr:regulatory iron-sulfur-containing complex subunit RicT [Agathobacter sp.]